MKTKLISVKRRDTVGKSSAKSLRNQGLVPVNLYGGESTHYFYGFINDFKDVIYTPEVFKIVLVEDGKKPFESVIQEVQFHPLSDDIIHIDFLEVTDEKEVKINVPVTFSGNAIGVKNGGRFLQKLRKIQVLGKVKDIPEKLNIDITKVNLGESIRIKDVQTESLEILNGSDVPVATVEIPRGMKGAKKAAAETKA